MCHFRCIFNELNSIVDASDHMYSEIKRHDILNKIPGIQKIKSLVYRK